MHLCGLLLWQLLDQRPKLLFRICLDRCCSDISQCTKAHGESHGYLVVGGFSNGYVVVLAGNQIEAQYLSTHLFEGRYCLFNPLRRGLDVLGALVGNLHEQNSSYHDFSSPE